MTSLAGREQVARQADCWVIKIGSSLITADGKGLDQSYMDGWVNQIAALRQAGRRVVLVSSGAVAEGMVRLGWQERPQTVHALQAAAAVGQMGLIQAWESRFRNHGLHTAQVLLTHEDVRDRQRYLNARSTLMTLLDLGVIPVVNENDTVATDEIRLGDNDTLAAMTANLIEADLLLLLTDQAGMFEEDPRQNPEAKLISEGKAGDESLLAMAGGSAGSLGRGGMRTKLLAAQWAARSGAHTVITNGAEDQVISRIAQGENLGTLLRPAQKRLGARKRWIAGMTRPSGQLVIDDGAAKALQQGGRSLLPVGVVRIEGEFSRGDLVSFADAQGRELGRGLVNYNSQEAQQLLGRSSEAIVDVLGYPGDEELIHRDNLVLS
ncbi:MAG: glutamate 5-kinase [Salinisphaeraceae bacterium]|nr:glutamate 5-kinase [Salinisphaeraceae bacterium]